ncbi:hypothetical protein IGI37_000398 [Enterococcus sp. AZ194]|uniref:hypothetical protein n=1 Tax=Enterococcus sp. AZ194 TaxID=2774629 RepID=UPI003F293B43
MKPKYFLAILGVGILCLLAYYQFVVSIFIAGIAFSLFLKQTMYHQSKAQKYAILTCILLYLIEFVLSRIIQSGFGVERGLTLKVEQYFYDFLIEFHLFYVFFTTLCLQTKMQFRNEN